MSAVKLLMNWIRCAAAEQTSLTAWRTGFHLRHLVCVWSHIGRDAQQHLYMLTHFLWNLTQHSWTQSTQLKKKEEESLVPVKNYSAI